MRGATLSISMNISHDQGRAPFALALHGGAGNISRDNLPPDQEAQCRAVLSHALDAGDELLRAGGRSLDVVEKVVRLLEDSPMFNAGKGASFTHEGRCELDASIMDGRTKRAGAVAGVTIIRNPVGAARAVLERSPYVFLIGRGAEDFARQQGLEIVDPIYFHTPRQWERLEQLRREQELQTPEKWGTVGAVALDLHGDLAAATSTGGMMNKRFGRVGDSPVIGAGTYADNATCAVSATGHGEHFLCNVAAYDIAALMEYKELSLQEASEEVVLRKLVNRGGEGGIIAIDKNGHTALKFNSAGMYRAAVAENGSRTVEIFK